MYSLGTVSIYILCTFVGIFFIEGNVPENIICRCSPRRES